MAEFTGLTKDIAEKYGSDRWGREAADLWTNTRAQIASNPLNLPTLHRKVSEQLTALSSQLRTWLDSQREGYEQRRQRYEEALDLAGMGHACGYRSTLNIPPSLTMRWERPSRAICRAIWTRCGVN